MKGRVAMRRNSLVRVMLTLAGVVAVAACGGPKTATLSRPATDVFGTMAAAAAASPCGPIVGGPPVPSAAAKSNVPARDDVVFYLAHPEDETLFTPGTMDALVRAKAHVFYAVMSHGEGGRLLKRDATGHLAERIGESPEKVAAVRDEEFANAMKLIGIEYAHLFPASAQADFAEEDVQGPGRAVHACAETIEKWDKLLPGGIAGVLKELVASIRTRRPRVIVTHDPRDDEDWLDHGHHKALGALVDIAARAAADWHVPGGPPHVVEELITIAPKQVAPDVTLDVGIEMRKKLMAANTSQFDPKKFYEVAERGKERYVVRWRAARTPLPPGGSLLAVFTKP